MSHRAKKKKKKNPTTTKSNYLCYFSVNSFSTLLLYISIMAAPLLWQVKYQSGKVTGVSHLPHDCLPNCSLFSHLQVLPEAGVRSTRDSLTLPLVAVCPSHGPKHVIPWIPLDLCVICVGVGAFGNNHLRRFVVARLLWRQRQAVRSNTELSTNHSHS